MRIPAAVPAHAPSRYPPAPILPSNAFLSRCASLIDTCLRNAVKCAPFPMHAASCVRPLRKEDRRGGRGLHATSQVQRVQQQVRTSGAAGPYGNGSMVDWKAVRGREPRAKSQEPKAPVRRQGGIAPFSARNLTLMSKYGCLENSEPISCCYYNETTLCGVYY